MIRGALASRYGISPLGRGVIRPASGGWWLSGGIAAANCIAAYQPKGAADYAASKVNLANPGTYNAVDGSAYPTWTNTSGWTFNGSTQYLNTGVIPSIDQSWSAIIRHYATDVANTCVLFSRSGPSIDFGIYQSSDTVLYPHNGKNVSIVIPTILNVNSVLAVVGNRGYKDGVLLTGVIPIGNSPATQPIFIGAANDSGQPLYFWRGNVYCAAIYNTVLSEPQVFALTNAMNAL